MAVFIFPAASAAPIKSIQRGTAASAGTITISAVDTSKTFVTSFSTGSSGTAAGSGSFSGTFSASGGSKAHGDGGSENLANSNGSPTSYVGTRTAASGTTSIISKEFGVVLTNSTTLTANGACNWQVVEYN